MSDTETTVKTDKGGFRVEVLDATGKAIAGYSGRNAIVFRSIDSLRFRPYWKGASDLSALQGKTIRLKFHLRRSKLYAFQIVSSKEKEK